MKKKLMVLFFALVLCALALPAATFAEDSYLTFEAQGVKSEVTFNYAGGTAEYSTDGGTTWNSCSSGKTVDLGTNGSVKFKGTNVKTDNNNHFRMTGSIAASGDVTSLTNGSGGVAKLTDYATDDDKYDYCYYYMFGGCTVLTDVSELKLSATTLTEHCYDYMFYNCTGLETTPALPATTLAESCYAYMFAGCTNLKTAPALPSTELTKKCYYYMFMGCTSLANAPDLDATRLADSCYQGMFSTCTNLTTAPTLPATTVKDCCYFGMFYNCTSLETAPDLSATTLAESCCEQMFSYCTALKEAPVLEATTLANSCYKQMFYGCTSLETAPDLPATTLANSCYYQMFSGCTNLKSAPDLPAKTLADSCYCAMFYSCEALTTAPALPAIKLENSCYSFMFYGCEALETVPDLPATELAEKCYRRMFYGCKALTVPGDLSDVTIVAASCCEEMYKDCTSLKVYKEENKTSQYGKAWKATNADNAEDYTDWALEMFKDTGGDLTIEGDAPEAGTVYYVLGAAAPAIVTGDGASYQIGSSEGLTFKSDADFYFFKCVKIDGTEIAETNYEKKKGSTIVTLKPAYLDTLSAGEHKIEIVSETGTAEAKFTITAAANTGTVNNPNTGLTDYDSGILLALLACAGAVMLMVVRKRIRG